MYDSDTVHSPDNVGGNGDKARPLVKTIPAGEAPMNRRKSIRVWTEGDTLLGIFTTDLIPACSAEDK